MVSVLPPTMATGGGKPMSIDIRWSPGAIKNFHLLDQSLKTLKDGWMRVWEMIPDGADSGPPDRIVSDNIKRNLDQGITPEMATWAPLAPKYATRVGRPRMLFNPNSDVYEAYVNNPDILYTNNTMTYAPNMAFHHAHYSWLREGYVTRTAIVPSREWFGMSSDFKEKMGHAMARVTQRVMNQAYAAGAI